MYPSFHSLPLTGSAKISDPHLDEFVKACYAFEPWVSTRKNGIFGWLCPGDDTFQPNCTRLECEEKYLRQVTKEAPQLRFVLMTLSLHASGSETSKNVRQRTMDFIFAVFKTPESSPAYDATDADCFRECIGFLCNLPRSKSPSGRTAEVLSNLNQEHPIIGTNALVHALAAVMTKPPDEMSDEDLLSSFAAESRDWVNSSSVLPSTRGALETSMPVTRQMAEQQNSFFSPRDPEPRGQRTPTRNPGQAPVSRPRTSRASERADAPATSDASTGTANDVEQRKQTGQRSRASPSRGRSATSNASTGTANDEKQRNQTDQRSLASPSRGRQGGGKRSQKPRGQKSSWNGMWQLLKFEPHGDRDKVSLRFAVMYYFIRGHQKLLHAVTTKILYKFEEETEENLINEFFTPQPPTTTIRKELYEMYFTCSTICIILTSSVLTLTALWPFSKSSTGKQYETCFLLACFVLTMLSNKKIKAEYEKYDEKVETILKDAASNATLLLDANTLTDNATLALKRVNEVNDTSTKQIEDENESSEILYIWNKIKQFFQRIQSHASRIYGDALEHDFEALLRPGIEIVGLFVLQCLLNNRNYFIPADQHTSSQRALPTQSGYIDNVRNNFSEFKQFIDARFKAEPMYTEGAMSILTAMSCDPAWKNKNPSLLQILEIFLHEDKPVGPSQAFHTALEHHALFVLALE
jgi:hypothetical protein